jgi:hypothetical protein
MPSYIKVLTLICGLLGGVVRAEEIKSNSNGTAEINGLGSITTKIFKDKDYGRITTQINRVHQTSVPCSATCFDSTGSWTSNWSCSNGYGCESLCPSYFGCKK